MLPELSELAHASQLAPQRKDARIAAVLRAALSGAMPQGLRRAPDNRTRMKAARHRHASWNAYAHAPEPSSPDRPAFGRVAAAAHRR